MHTVDAELKLMHSFSKKKLPIDVATTVAMRMSRAIVSSICRIGDSQASSLSEETHKFLQQATHRLIDLSAVYEHRILEADNKDSLLLIWKA